jgi:hypothetical protein
MKFPLILYMSPEGPKWQPKYFAHLAPAPIDRSRLHHAETRGVQFAPRGLVVNVPSHS